VLSSPGDGGRPRPSLVRHVTDVRKSWLLGAGPNPTRAQHKREPSRSYAESQFELPCAAPRQSNDHFHFSHQARGPSSLPAFARPLPCGLADPPTGSRGQPAVIRVMSNPRHAAHHSGRVAQDRISFEGLGEQAFAERPS